MRLLLLPAVLITILAITPVFASDPAGNWCRSESGNLLDVITVTRQGEVFRVDLREGWGKPVYSEGVGTFTSNRLTATLKGKTQTTHVPMTISGDILTYVAFNLDGSFWWKGSYLRCKR